MFMYLIVEVTEQQQQGSFILYISATLVCLQCAY